MRQVRPSLALALLAQLAALRVLSLTVGLGPVGWAAGVAVGLTVVIGLGLGLRAAGQRSLGAANRVTLVRTILVGSITALLADPAVRPGEVGVLVALCTIALVLDAVDGWVARRTGSVSPLGARFDMETDAFLILVLSAHVATMFGGWVLAIGLARYGFWIAGRLVPWMAATLPYRYWRKPVTAIQGITLTAASSGLLPHWPTVVLLLAALALLTESFGRDVWWLWRHRDRVSVPDAVAADTVSARRRVAGWVLTGSAAVLLWFALVTPNSAADVQPRAFLRVPIEALVLVAAVFALPARAGRLLAWVAGAALGLLSVLKLLNLGFTATLDRPFDPLTDWSYLPSAIGVLDDSVGRAGTVASLGAAVLVVVVLLVAVPMAAVRILRLLAGRRRTTVRIVGLGAVIWVVAAGLGLQISPGAPVAAADAATLAGDQVDQIGVGLKDQRSFAEQIAHDPMTLRTGDDLLGGLRGKDVLFVFVESYGRVAIQDSGCAAGVNAVLDTGTKQLADAGFHARSGFLTSPTFGGISWLAHSTLQSGLWIDSQTRYDELLSSSRLTLATAFGKAGWRTVGDVAPNFKDWPEGTSFYHYDQIYDGRNVGYRGPGFSYADMPDQYILSAFQRLELARAGRPPLMAEIDLVSSHTPWAPLPTMVDWSAVGDGSIFDPMPAQGQSPAAAWRTSAATVQAYGQAIQYSMSTLISFVTTYGDPNLVLVVLGDHQPASAVSGPNPSHDVPVSIIAADPTVLGRIGDWGWQPGLRPDPQAPVWPMDQFRDRFLSAFS
jgi:phosphatidylglycerophosphate synthase